MNDSDIDSAIRNGINSQNPVKELCKVAIMLRDSGKTQKEVECIFTGYRVAFENDDDQTKYNNIMDTMDFIVGWCSVGREIFNK